MRSCRTSYYCGLVGHLVNDCPACLEVIGENGRVDESKLSYGDWLRARLVQQDFKYIGGSTSNLLRVLWGNYSNMAINKLRRNLQSLERVFLVLPLLLFMANVRNPSSTTLQEMWLLFLVIPIIQQYNPTLPQQFQILLLI